MRRYLIDSETLRIPSYPAMLYLGLVLGVVAGNVGAHHARLDPFRVFVATYLLLIPALIGARALFVASRWSIFVVDPPRIWRRSEGGMALYGGLPVALLASVPTLAALRLPFAVFWDVASFTILTGMIFARIGCLLNGCCAGRPSNGWLCLWLPNARGEWSRRWPTQLFEAAWATVVLFVAALMWPHRPFPGALFLLVVVAYTFGRLLLESTREALPQAKDSNLQRAVSASFMVTALVLLVVGWRM